jgi:hypothetical protein
LTFYTPKKVAPPLIRVEKKFLRNWANRISTDAEFCADFKNVQKSRIWQKGKKICRKTEFFKFSKKSFFREKIFGNFLTFLKSAQNFASFDTLCAQF